MKTLKKILIRVLLLAALLVIMNYVYTTFFFERDLKEHSEMIDLVREIPPDVDIIYVGESSNNNFRINDADKRHISDFIADHFPGITLYDITEQASHAEVFEILLNQIPDTINPRVVVVTLNLRSFNAQWIYSDLETALQKRMVLLRDNPPLVNRFMLSFEAYDLKSEEERVKQVRNKWRGDEFDFPYPFPHQNVEEWDKWMAATGVRDENGNIDYEKTELACHYIKGFGFQIDTMSNPRIKNFNNIVELAGERGWQLVFNLMAENYEKAGKLVGDDLLFLLDQNRQLLVNYYERRGVRVVDNLFDLADEEFTDQYWTTEHYGERGRKMIAGNVARTLKAFFPEAYSEPVYAGKHRTKFFNDCENNDSWGQVQTITSEVSYSGMNSSETGKGNDYSITLEYPMDLLPDLYKDSIRVCFMTFTKSPAREVKLVLQAGGNTVEPYWEGIPLFGKMKKQNQWEPFRHTFLVLDLIRDADWIKIYVFNPSDIKVWIDDFSVQFN